MSAWRQKPNSLAIPSGYTLTPVDPDSGLPICEFDPIPLGEEYSYTFSPDLSQLAVMVTHSSDRRDSELQVIDLKGWEVYKTGFSLNSWVYALRISPDGKQLAIVIDASTLGKPGRSRLAIFNLERKGFDYESTLPYIPDIIEFTPSGERLALYGRRAAGSEDKFYEPRAGLFDIASQKFIWEQPLHEIEHGLDPDAAHGETEQPVWQQPALAYDKKEQILYIVHAHQEAFTRVDYSIQASKTLTIKPKLSWIESLVYTTAGSVSAKATNGTTKYAVLSPEGEELYVIGWSDETTLDKTGNWQITHKSLGLQIVDAVSAIELARVDTDAMTLEISGDGNKLLLKTNPGGLSPETVVLDRESLEVILKLPSQSLTLTSRLNGEPVLLAERFGFSNAYKFALLDPLTFEAIQTWPGVNRNNQWLKVDH